MGRVADGGPAARGDYDAETQLARMPRDIRKGLRDLQDIYSEPIDLNEVGDIDDGGVEDEENSDAESERQEWLQEGKEAHSATDSNYIPTAPENKAGDRGTGTSACSN